ncbi:hypothetical protein RHMOL_Rhmol07G0199000 [Rhododendron molle]|uniref:Uncharacterized protein n=1 Tax=Rhododendron molle TaxID=49168 RepID=A0ACC0N3N4_RHOML|nr:hypothetical protein RHMOL_Rhmol07G0199000 [Rhododendron molle]
MPKEGNIRENLELSTVIPTATLCVKWGMLLTLDSLSPSSTQKLGSYYLVLRSLPTTPGLRVMTNQQGRDSRGRLIRSRLRLTG